MSAAKAITDHRRIREWAEARGGRPARVKEVKGEGGILRFDFGEKDDSLEEIPWETFFDVFEKNELALLEQEETAGGKPSRFSKFIRR
jgi:hypothetical protein